MHYHQIYSIGCADIEGRTLKKSLRSYPSFEIANGLRVTKKPLLPEVDRVLCFFSSRLNWDPPPLTHRRVCPPPLDFGGHTRLLERVWGGPNSDEGTDTVIL
jgi:hypothetical protein